MNPFEQHGILNLSATSLNLWAAEPAMWCLQKLAKKKTGVGPAAHRGTAAETGIVMGLLDPDAKLVDCQQAALDQFDELTRFDLNPKCAKERDAIPGIVEQGIKKLKPAGIPDEIQQEINVMLPDIPVPFKGFVDVGWKKHGIRLDIKSQLRLSSEISEPHRRQVSLYLHGTNMTGRVCYITPKAAEIYVIEDAAAHVEELRQIGLRLMNFLALSDDTEKLLRTVVPNYSSFYWNDAGARAAGREVFGI